MDSIPVIDISSLVDKADIPGMEEDPEVVKVASELDQACREIGFFYVKGHKVPNHIVEEVREKARKFFNLSVEEKNKIKMSPSTGYRGYQKLGDNITQGTPDLHEAIDCYREIEPNAYGSLGKVLEGKNLWPDYPEEFGTTMDDYVSILKDICRKIMRGISVGLNGRPDTFEGKRAGDPFWVLRIIGYPEPDVDSETSGIGCGAHTDYGLLTLVNQDDDISALQVKTKTGEWILATPIPDTFVCNIGDMLKIWTNGLYESTLHRVVNKNYRYRVSVPFFYETNFDAVVEPLKFCEEITGCPARFKYTVYGEHISRKVLTNFV